MSTYPSPRRAVSVVAALVAIVLLASCSSSPDASRDADGKITIGTMFPPGTLDPTTGTQGSDLGYLDLVFDRLIQQDPETGELIPMLATSWEFVGEDNLALRLELREDVTFHDGTPFDAQAVVDYSHDFIEAGNIANLLEYVTDITADDEYTVTYHLSQENARLPMGLTARAGMIPSPTAVEEAGDDFALHPVGTGPYEFVSQVQGSSYSFTRFDDYWDDENLERVKDIEFSIFQGDTALVNAIRGGQVDVGSHLVAQNVATLESNPDVDVMIGPEAAIGIAYLNASLAPVDDERVRLAINLALDRDVIAETVTEGLGDPVTQALPEGAHGHIADMDPLWEQDVDEAKRLMAEAGYGDGVSMSCYAYAGLGFERAGPILVAQLAEIGIDLEITPATPAQVGPFFTNETDAHCAFANWGSTEPFKAYQLLWSNSYYNAGKVDLGIDDQIAQFYTAYDEAEEEELVRSMLEEQLTNPGYVPIMRSPWVDVYRTDIGGQVISPLGINNMRGLHYTN